ncbi:ABC transporter substrate-binding protein [Erythrobacter sp. JK5]|uniref:ABC transporter substrate-binding protein n=1 Tax=Erythrobacter sp. JK5 TaxID=2829500 RepID=UPI001BA91FA2|nr:ABC transporter substrate-binding protein [Erythrobacter sp. JK5]QUL37503.1 peptide ABC transporter substrate-binding protein [Erythrobacter sp. JK5]
MRFCLPALAAVFVAACGPSGDNGPVEVAIVGQPENLFETGVRLSPAAQHIRGATVEGLVALDPAGQIVPAIAERWIVTDDGLSYIFRLRASDWPDGQPITAVDIRDLLRAQIARLEGTSLGLDIAKVTDIRAMAGRVVELRLSSPMPEFLRLLAQPELGLVRSGAGSGPMVLAREGESAVARLIAIPPEERGLPAREDWQELARPLTVRAMPTEMAVEAFSNGDIDLLMNGRLSGFPLAELGPLSRGAVQVDPALGLFGLVFRSEDGVLADRGRREALSLAIDRSALIEPFGLGGWQPTSWVVPPELFDLVPVRQDRWSEQSLAARRSVAAQRIAQWRAAQGRPAEIRVALPPGPGSDLLFRQLARDWATIGVTAIRVAPDEGPDLELRDRLARYSSPRWYLNQFNCELEIGLCSPTADALVARSLGIRDPLAKQQTLAEAHAALIADEVFIPLGAPVRWSLVRGAIDAYVPNQWGLHPLFPLSQPTI